MNMGCYEDVGKTGNHEFHEKHPSSYGRNCKDSPAIPAVVQNIVNGMKVCASRSETLSFATAIRPIASTSNTNNQAYECPSGYKACNEDLLATKDLAEKAICIEDSLDIAEHCPITKFEFTLDSYSAQDALKFESVAPSNRGNLSDNGMRIYFSKLTADLPVY